MPNVQSKLTAQGQISVPSEVRRKLGLGPGSVLQWEEEGDRMIVRRVGQFSSEDIHAAIFGGKKPKAKTLGELKQGIRDQIRKRHARD
jgi:AbrB family looped-hinge helix DNA binding protein